MSEFKKYFTARSHVFMRPYEPGEEIRWVNKVHVSPRDGATGSPKVGDYIAYNAEKPDNHFLVSAENFKSYEPAGDGDGQMVPKTSEAIPDAPMVRDPVGAAEIEEQKALNGEESSKTVLTKNAPADETTENDPQEASQETEEDDGEASEEDGEDDQSEATQEAPQANPEPAADPVKDDTAQTESTEEEAPKKDEKPAKEKAETKTAGNKPVSRFPSKTK